MRTTVVVVAFFIDGLLGIEAVSSSFLAAAEAFFEAKDVGDVDLVGEAAIFEDAAVAASSVGLVAFDEDIKSR